MITNGIYKHATLTPSPNKGGSITPTAIIVHDTAGRLAKGSSVSWLRNPDAKASAHFVVERDGTVVQLVSCNVKAWHSGTSELDGRNNVNDFSIGIEFVNPGALSESGAKGARAYFGEVFDRKQYKIEEVEEVRNKVTGGKVTTTHPPALWMPYTEAQLNAGLALCLALCNTYNITQVQPHWYISPKRKIDTNPLFPLAWLTGRLAGRQNEEPVADYSSATIRRYPSFYDNILPDFQVHSLGVQARFEVEMEPIPRDLIGFTLLWQEVFDKDGNKGWILKG